MEKNKNKGVKKIISRIGIALGALILLISIALGIVLNTILSPKKLTPIIEKLAQNYITTDITLGRVDVTLFSTFPNLSIQIDSLGIKQVNDTIPDLIFTEKFIATVNPFALLKKSIIVEQVVLKGANIHVYNDSIINPLQVLNLEDKAPKEKDTTSSSSFNLKDYSVALKKIAIESSDITIDDRVKNFYSHLDGISFDLSASLLLKEIKFNMSLSLPEIIIKNQGVELANSESISIDSEMYYDHSSMLLRIEQADILLNEIALKTGGELRADTLNSRLLVDLYSTLSSPSLDQFLGLIPAGIIDQDEELITNGSIDLAININGEYSNTMMPILSASLDLDGGQARYESKKVAIESIDCAADLLVDMNRPKESYLNIERFSVNASDILDLDLKGRIQNLLVDPEVDMSLESHIDFNRFAQIFPLQKGVTLEGTNDSKIDLQVKASDVELGNYGAIYVNGESIFDGLIISLDGSEIEDDSSQLGKLAINIDQASLLFGDRVNINKKQSTARTLVAEIKLSDIFLRDSLGGFIGIKNLGLSAGVNYNNNDLKINGVGLKFTSENINMGIKDSLDIQVAGAEAALILVSEGENRQAKIYGDVSSESITFQNNIDNSNLALSLVKMDVDLLKSKDNLDTKHKLEMWDKRATIGFSDLDLYTEKFPINIALVDSRVALENSTIELTNAHIELGESTIIATGYISNLLGSLLGDNKAKLDGKLAISSPLINLPEILEATTQITTQNSSSREINISDNNSTEEVTASVFMVPEDIKFDFDLDIDKVMLKDSDIENVVGRAYINRGVLELEKLEFYAIGAKARLGMIYKNQENNSTDAFATLSLSEVNINRIKELIPEIDSMMPMIRSFEGIVDFSIRAQTALSEGVGFDPAKLKAAISLEGTNLVLMDSETFSDLSKILMFKNKDKNLIDSLAVHITANDSKIDVLPFEISIDRYRAIVGGTQNIDAEFNIDFGYNVSIVKSPLPFKAGVDIKGDLEDFGFKITRAKLKKTDFAALDEHFKTFSESINAKE